MRILVFLVLMLVLFGGRLSTAQETKQGQIVAKQGQIVAVNESIGTITVKLRDGNIESYFVKDGLLFNAVKIGDAIRFDTQAENGRLAILNVQKQ